MSVERDVVEALGEAWDREPDGIWEPVRFKVGDRVRIQTSECQVEAEPGSPQRIRGLVLRGHEPEENGMTGVVAETGETRIHGHPYLVEWDRMIPGVLAIGSAYAACELLPLDGAS